MQLEDYRYNLGEICNPGTDNKCAVPSEGLKTRGFQYWIFAVPRTVSIDDIMYHERLDIQGVQFYIEEQWSDTAPQLLDAVFCWFLILGPSLPQELCLILIWWQLTKLVETFFLNCYFLVLSLPPSHPICCCHQIQD